VAALSLGLVVVTLLNYRTAVRVAEETLRNQGVGISLELAAEARHESAGDRGSLQALVQEQRRREVAFLAIFERDGTVLAHTNPRLVGTRIEDAAFLAVRETGRLVGRMETLETGEEVFELSVPFHVPPTGPGGTVDVRQPRFRILRLALHTAPARQIVYQAQAQVLFVGVLVLVLLGLSAWQIRTLRRYLALQAESARQERLAALGGMAAVLAHEIRNPLGAIKGLAQFLGEKTSGDPTRAEMTQTIARETTRLERLVNDLLTYARPRPPERQAMDLAALVGRVLPLLGPAAAEAGVTVHADVARGIPPISGDPEQLQQLFGNLLLNAIQAMPNGGIVRVSAVTSPSTSSRAASAPRDQTWIDVCVQDSGPGIPEADVPHIFEPFFTTRAKGTGLGLAICRQIAEAHGGTIRVSSTGPEGTRIEVTLPAEEPSHG
jgi:two-component system sensor histidine kinase HydH